MKITLSDKAVCFIPNPGMTTVVVSMVTRHITLCYENYAFRQSRLFHSELWNDYSSGVVSMVTRYIASQTKPSALFVWMAQRPR